MSSPYKGDGETVYATSPDTGESEGERDWPDHTDPEWLHHHYWVLGRSQQDMADIVGVDNSTVSYWMRKHDIPRRNISKAVSKGIGGDERLLDESWLREQYFEKERTQYEIAEICDVSQKAVYDAFDRFGLEARENSKAKKIQYRRQAGDRKYNDGVWLHHQYVKRGRSIADIADGLDVAPSTIRDALNRHGIHTRSVKAGALLHSKKQKCPTDTGDRQLVSSEGIDASWQDSLPSDWECYLDYRDPTWLRERFSEGMRPPEIADRSECDVSADTVRNWRDRFGIEG